MSRIFITGSTDGLGYAAARTLIEEGHEVLFHARSQARTTVLSELASQSLGIVIGDLSSSAETHKVAEQVNAFGRIDAIIHNAGVYRLPTRSGFCNRFTATHKEISLTQIVGDFKPCYELLVYIGAVKDLHLAVPTVL